MQSHASHIPGPKSNANEENLLSWDKSEMEVAPLQLMANKSRQITQGNTYQQMANQSAQVRQLKAYQQMANSSISSNRAPNVIQRVIIADRVKTINPQSPKVLNEDPEVIKILTKWIQSTENYTFRTWELAVQTAKALIYLKGQGFGDPGISILDANFTSGNCHGYTFGYGGTEFLDISDPLVAWHKWLSANKPKVLFCTKGKEVAHSAKIISTREYQQTLPNGPTFSTTKQDTIKGYTSSFDMSSQKEAQEFFVYANKMKELDDFVKDLLLVEQALDRLFQIEKSKVSQQQKEPGPIELIYKEVSLMSSHTISARKRLNAIIVENKIMGTSLDKSPGNKKEGQDEEFK